MKSGGVVRRYASRDPVDLAREAVVDDEDALIFLRRPEPRYAVLEGRDARPDLAELRHLVRKHQPRRPQTEKDTRNLHDVDAVRIQTRRLSVSDSAQNRTRVGSDSHACDNLVEPRAESVLGLCDDQAGSVNTGNPARWALHQEIPGRRVAPLGARVLRRRGGGGRLARRPAPP